MLTMSKVIILVRTFSPFTKETRIVFFPKASIFSPPKPNSEFPAGSSVRLSRFICSKGLMKRMSVELPLSTRLLCTVLAELPLSMRMLCTVNPAMLAVATKVSMY